MRAFSGQTYKGRRDNADIELIQLSDVICEGNKVTRFYALTKSSAVYAGCAAYVEGAIDGDRINIYVYESEKPNASTDFAGLARCVLSSYRNLSEFVLRYSRTSERRTGFTEINGTISVSDSPGKPVGMCSSHTNKDRNSDRKTSRHIRRGHLKLGHPYSPAVVHLEQFSPDQLLEIGFAPDGTPSIEAVQEYTALDDFSKRRVIERRGLRSIEEIRQSCRQAAG